MFIVFHCAADVTPFRDEVIEDDRILGIALSVIMIVEDTRQPVIEDFCVSFINSILAQTYRKIYQFLVVVPICSDKNMVISGSQICVDKARLQRYNEHIRNDNSVYYKLGGQIWRGISDSSLPLLYV